MAIKRSERESKRIRKEASDFTKAEFARNVHEGMSASAAAEATKKAVKEKFSTDWLALIGIIMELIKALKEAFNKKS